MKLLSFFLGLLYGWASLVQCEELPSLLIKFPTRQRARTFFRVLNSYYKQLSGKVCCHFLISCDSDDTGKNGMNTKKALRKLKKYPNLTYYIGTSASKIDAVNRDIEKHCNDYDIILVASDDMLPVQQGYDLAIVTQLKQAFPDLDGTLNYHDGTVGQTLNTLPILGTKYYKRFNYIYHPAYKSICADMEFTLVARMLGKEQYVDTPVIKHCWGQQRDALFYKNEARHLYDHDKKVLREHMANRFALPLEQVSEDFHMQSSLDIFNYQGAPVKLSILIATIDKRQDKFTQLLKKLLDQVQQNKLEHKVEVLFYKDDQRYKVGHKRNRLLEQSKGEYVCFLDDDDDVSDDYVLKLYTTLANNPDTDCLSCTGITYKPNKAPQHFVHSLQYHRAFIDANGTACSPVYHLNPIKREYAIQAKFPDKNYNEDTTWARRLYDLKLLKKEVEIKEPYYFYYLDYMKSEAIPECARKDRRIRWTPTGMLYISNEIQQ